MQAAATLSIQKTALCLLTTWAKSITAACQTCKLSMVTWSVRLEYVLARQEVCHVCQHFTHMSSMQWPTLFLEQHCHLKYIILSIHACFETGVLSDSGNKGGTCLSQAFLCMDSMVSTIGIHISAAPYGMTKCPVVPAACCLLEGPPPCLKVKEPDGLHLRAPCVIASLHSWKAVTPATWTGHKPACLMQAHDANYTKFSMCTC